MSRQQRPQVGNKTSSYARSSDAATMNPTPPPPLQVRYFYTSSLAIDDPLSPIPPIVASVATASNAPPRPFSQFDNAALEKAWLATPKARVERRKTPALGSGKSKSGWGSVAPSSLPEAMESKSQGMADMSKPSPAKSVRKPSKLDIFPEHASLGSQEDAIDFRRAAAEFGATNDRASVVSQDSGIASPPAGSSLAARNPFIRAPSRTNVRGSPRNPSISRPVPNTLDSYDWGDDVFARNGDADDLKQREPTDNNAPISTTTVPVGVSRLHNVRMPALQMEPIYWSPVNDVAPIFRGTWFYADNMLPVEANVANMLEAGYLMLQPWTETWNDQLNSAIDIGAAGEMKILHQLWPEPLIAASRAATSRGDIGTFATSIPVEDSVLNPITEQDELVRIATKLIDDTVNDSAIDNKAAGAAPYGHDGVTRSYLRTGILYADEKEAFILRPSLQPSEYYGRKPFASYIHKGHTIGIRVVRGFNQAVWDQLHPVKNNLATQRARRGVSTSEGDVSIVQRALQDPTLRTAERPEVSDLVLVIHGIGQKLSERVESYHFTHAINAFRRDVNVELGNPAMKTNFRSGMGEIMVLPVNWRLTLSFEDGGFREELEGSALNDFSLKDITPESLASVRSIVSDVMLDIPYYLSPQHGPKMVKAVVKEANRVYRLWCANNPGFEKTGRVHLIAHSLGSVMAVDILSTQPSYIEAVQAPASSPIEDQSTTHLAFNVTNLFTIGSPSGLFLLLKQGTLLPRKDRRKAASDGYANTLPGVCGEQHAYGCLAVDNIYNILNPYDPVAYRLNACVDAAYSISLKQAWVPTTTSSIFAAINPFRSKAVANTQAPQKSLISRLPSNVELETHDFTREEIAETRAFLLNDNGQVDWFLKYGGGPLEIQYLTMLGAHSSYWLSHDFVRLVVQEIGRRPGREGTLAAMRAVKKSAVR